MFSEYHYEQGVGTLYVDGEPFYIRGGEVRNSSSSSAAYMLEKVWPAIRSLHLNTLLLPVSWEMIEPAPDTFDFTLLDALLAQAQQEQVRLILLWFGLWKNGQSSYVPVWVKQDTETYHRAVLQPDVGMQTPDCVLTPCCPASVMRDANAFAHLMQHLKEHDTQHRVIAIQVENESGMLGTQRDFCEEAERLFHAEIPPAVATHFGVQGTWKDAFGTEAPAQFMSWCFASAVEQIAAMGKRIYPLPMYVNTWTIQYPGEYPGSYPAGGPTAEYAAMWRLMAPSIDWISPDSYLPTFDEECRKYTFPGNGLFIPETIWGIHASAYLLYAFGEPHAFGVCPYSIETIITGKQEKSGALVQEALAAAGTMGGDLAARCICAANQVIDALWEQAVSLRGTKQLRGFLQQQLRRTVVAFPNCTFLVQFEAMDDRTPLGGGVILQETKDTFLIAAQHCRVELLPPLGTDARVELLQLMEMKAEDGNLSAVRLLNGDDQHLYFGELPTVLRCRMHLLSNR